MEGSASQAGFYYQNNVAALKILDCLLFNSDIRNIYLENYEKGNHIDDIIIYRQNRIDFYQVKWSDNEENAYTLYNLLSSANEKKSIFKQLAEGYGSVKEDKLGFSIILYTTKRGSPKKRPSEGIKFGLTEFITNVIIPIKETGVRYDAIPNYGEYKDIISIVRTETGLDEISFNDFLSKLEFKFNQPILEQTKRLIDIKLNSLGIESQLYEKLLDCIVNWSITGEQITKDKVLRGLGIIDRLEDKLSHYFNVVEDNLYVSNSDLIKKLSVALEELQGGYIFVEGLPGIGKSTALTKFKEICTDVVFSYYCFIPDAKNEFGELRHKSDYFLKSICIAIENQFPDVNLPTKYSINYEEKIYSYIEMLGTLDKKIVFIVDGLDHVHRDIEFQENSLLNQIKGNLPDNIFFILSSQYKAALSPSVLAIIDSDQRRHIVVSRFTQKEIKQYLDNKGIYAGDFIDRIEKISDGIPLYLHYISEILLNAEYSEYDKILNDFPFLEEGSINSYHEYLFHKIENNEFAKSVLTVLALRKESSDIDTIFEILKLVGLKESIIDVQEVIIMFIHLLKPSLGKNYLIFHNSFREFIITKNIFLKDRFNKAIASYYENNPLKDEAYRNYFRHLYEIGFYQKITETTTLSWIKSAWSNFRSLSEIENNIEIALKACIEMKSLSEFIRIGYLKVQVEKITWNLDNSILDFSLLFLNTNMINNSIRTIWDGDFVLKSKEYFIKYLIDYYDRTGEILPSNIVKQGFEKILVEKTSDNLTSLYKAEILVYRNIVDVFVKIDKIKWQKSDEFRSEYIKEHYSNEENDKTNLIIKSEIINFLFKYKRYDLLNELLEHQNSDDVVITKTQISIAKLLLLNEQEKAIEIFKSINQNILTEKEYLDLISYCSCYLPFEVIKDIILERELSTPEMTKEIIDREEMHYQLRSDIIELFNTLKSFWIYKPDFVKKLTLLVSTFSGPSFQVYTAILLLSELWIKYKNNTNSKEAWVSEYKAIIKVLYFDHDYDLKKVHDGIFDHNSDKYFISISIYKLYNIIFSNAIDMLSPEGCENIVNYWFELEKSLDGYKYYNVPLSIAKIIYKSKYPNLKTLITKLINYGEELARKDEETSSLIESLGEICEVYGICGLNEDYERLYNELFEVSFGVAYKKDYQTSYIVSPLALLHKIDPDNTLKRLEEVFVVQNQFVDVGSGRMQHICLSELITFIGTKYPELAFALIKKEERNISRDETLEMVLTPFIENGLEEELYLIFSIIKTLPRWGRFSSRENYFLNISILLLKRAIILNDSNFIKYLLEEVKYNLIVESDSEDSLSKISEVLLKYEYNIEEYSLPEPIKEEPQLSITNVRREEKFNIEYNPPEIKELMNLLEENFNKFDETIAAYYVICLKNRRNEILRGEYYKFKSVFNKFYIDIYPSINNGPFNSNVFIRNFIQFKNIIINSKPSVELKQNELEYYLNELLLNINNNFPNNVFKTFIDDNFNFDDWIENTLKYINGTREYIFEQVLSISDMFRIVDDTSIFKYTNILLFINKWCKDSIRGLSLLRLAKRLYSINIVAAKQILEDITKSNYGFILFSRHEGYAYIEQDIINAIFQIDSEYGKKILLKSYFSEDGKMGEFFLANVNQIAGLYDYYDEKNLPYIYYKANLLYNQELAKGLPTKECDYKMITNHEESKSFDNIVIDYILSLFDYPVFKIREAALQSLYGLVLHRLDYLDCIFSLGIDNGSDNQKELCILLIHALSLNNNDILIKYKNRLLELTNLKHFNIIESVKDLLLTLNHKNDLLTKEENEDLLRLNKKGIISYNKTRLTNLLGRNFLYSKYQSKLVSIILDNEDDDSEFQDDVYTDLITIRNVSENTSEKESVVHRNYNINTNFDTIEIYSPYTDEVKNSMNYVLYEKIKRGCFSDDSINQLKYLFRILDPSKLLFKNSIMPSYINWIPKEISDDAFINFDDINNFENMFINREEKYITVYEDGIQRLGLKYKDNGLTCYFKVYTFLKNKSIAISNKDFANLRVTPYVSSLNSYISELPINRLNTTVFPIKGIIPILEISSNYFRGEKEPGIAMLIPNIIEDIGIEKIDLLELMKNKHSNIQAIRWQSKYSDGRRRYKPSSEGFTLKIRKDILKQYLDSNGLELCFNVSLRRSVTQYEPEKNMAWHNYVNQFASSL